MIEAMAHPTMAKSRLQLAQRENPLFIRLLKSRLMESLLRATVRIRKIWEMYMYWIDL
jgi:hypothetical protein